MREESESSKKESSITFPIMKTGTSHINQEREKVCPVNSSSNAEPGYSKNSQNENLINSVSALINARLTEFRSEMVTMINKNRDQPVSLGDKDSYYEDFDTKDLKGEKAKTSDDLSALSKNRTENKKNGPAVGQKSLTMMVVITLRQKFRVF